MAEMWEAILEDWQQMFYNICNVVGLLYGMCKQTLLESLSMWHNAVKFVPRLMSSDQNEYHIAVCTELKEQAENDPSFITNIIIGD